MNLILTFYLSRIIGVKIYSPRGKYIGKIEDLLVDSSGKRPYVVGVLSRNDKKTSLYVFSSFEIIKVENRYIVRCNEEIELEEEKYPKSYFLAKKVLDKQIVDIDGRKLVRVNDLRLVLLQSGAYVVAVDVGIEGILRRLGYAKVVKTILSALHINLSSKFILWDNVETVESTHSTIKMGMEYSKLETLHPSDLADIFEEMDKTTRANVFAALDEHKAADVLEELETEAQVQIIETLTKEKAADVLEKMRPSEAADLIDELAPHKAEELLNAMDEEASADVRDLLEYSDKQVGSIMSTDFISFAKNVTAGQTIEELRLHKPENNTLYSILITDEKERLVGTVSLRDIVVADPSTPLHNIMDNQFISVFDDDKLGDLSEIISKYNLLAVPVIDNASKIQGVVIIDDIMEELLENGKL